MLGVEISKVQSSGGPKDMELVLIDAVLQPVKSHVHGSGPDLFDRSVGNTNCCGIVDLDRCGWLLVPKFDESGT